MNVNYNLQTFENHDLSIGTFDANRILEIDFYSLHLKYFAVVDSVLLVL